MISTAKTTLTYPVPSPSPLRPFALPAQSANEGAAALADHGLLADPQILPSGVGERSQLLGVCLLGCFVLGGRQADSPEAARERVQQRHQCRSHLVGRNQQNLRSGARVPEVEVGGENEFPLGHLV